MTSQQVATFREPRLPYHPAVEERFGVDKAGWKALVEAVFPAAQSPESVILALSYCKARGLDPFKKNVHIVPIWDGKQKALVDTVWPGIGELRTTAFRTKQYAGRDATKFGPDRTMKFGDNGQVEATFPEFAQVTVYRMIAGQRVAFEGPPVYWVETFSEAKGGVPNSMWRKRPRGQLDKCAEAAALRAAFPEEIGDDFTDAEAGLIYQHGGTTIDQTPTAQQLASRPTAESDARTVEEGDGWDPESEEVEEEPTEPEAPQADAPSYPYLSPDGEVIDFNDPADFALRFMEDCQGGDARHRDGLRESNEDILQTLPDELHAQCLEAAGELSSPAAPAEETAPAEGSPQSPSQPEPSPGLSENSVKLICNALRNSTNAKELERRVSINKGSYDEMSDEQRKQVDNVVTEMRGKLKGGR